MSRWKLSSECPQNVCQRCFWFILRVIRQASWISVQNIYPTQVLTLTADTPNTQQTLFPQGNGCLASYRMRVPFPSLLPLNSWLGILGNGHNYPVLHTSKGF